MNDASLHDGLLPHRAHRVGQALQPVADQHAHVPDTAVLDFRQDPQPVLGAFSVAVLSRPQSQHVTLAVHGDAQGQVDGPVRDLALADLHVDSVDEDYRVNRIERPALPFRQAFHDPVGNSRDRLLGDLGAIDLGQVRGDLPVRQPFRRQGNDQVVDPGQPPLPFGDDYRLETGIPVPRHAELHRAHLGDHRLGAVAITGIAAIAAFRVGASFLEVGYFRVFRSCGEVEALDGVLVVAGEVVFVAVAFLVIPHVVVEVAVDDDGAELKNGLGAVGGPSRAGNSESVFDDEPAGALDHAGGDGPALFEGLVVFHVLLVVRQVGDCPVHVGEVEAALAGVRAGFAGDGGEGGRDGLCAAVQDAQQLPVGPLARGGGVAGVQGGGGLADIAADVDVIDQDRHLQAALLRLGLDGGDLLPVPVDEEDPLAGPLRVAAVGLVIGRGDHVLDGLGNRRRHPFIAGLRPGVRLAAGGRGGDVPRLADGGGEVGDGDDLGHLLDPGPGRIALPAVLAVLRAHGDALAVALHHDHVGRGQVRVRVAGALLVEIARPGGEILREAGELGAADRDAGPGLDDLLGLPEPAGGQVEGRQGPHPQGVRVIGQDLPGVGRVQVRLAPVPVGQPGDADRPEHAGHAPAVPGLDGAVPDPRGTGNLRGPLLAGTVDVERGLQQPPLQLP